MGPLAAAARSCPWCRWWPSSPPVQPALAAPSAGFFELPPLLVYGRISYGVYLYHPILLSLAVKSQPWIPLNVSEQGPGRFLVASAATIVVASISWMVFEKPLNSLKRHFPYVARARSAGTRRRCRLARQSGGAYPGGSPDGRTPTLDLQRTDALTMTAAPLVSVLLPVYNAGPYLAAALGSILRQDYDRLEVIAIDDGSTDNSLEILERYRQADSRISIISRENRGLVATLNEGLRLAQGELVARMDADDVAYPWRLSRQVALFERRPELGFCGAGVDILFAAGSPRASPIRCSSSAASPILSMFFTIFMHPTVVYNRKVIETTISITTRPIGTPRISIFSGGLPAVTRQP